MKGWIGCGRAQGAPTVQVRGHNFKYREAHHWIKQGKWISLDKEHSSGNRAINNTGRGVVCEREHVYRRTFAGKRPIAPGQVTEGSDLQLECRVSCRPPPTAFSWFRDSNLIATDQNLTLRSIRSRDSGTYRYRSLYPQVTLLHCKKRLAVSLSQARMSLTKLSLAENNLIFPGQGEFGR
jgi:hypothetical protein